MLDSIGWNLNGCPASFQESLIYQLPSISKKLKGEKMRTHLDTTVLQSRTCTTLIRTIDNLIDVVDHENPVARALVRKAKKHLEEYTRANGSLKANSKQRHWKKYESNNI